MAISQHEKNKGKTDEWWTPLEIVKSLGAFDLDPCGDPRHHTANTIYHYDGLNKEWFGRVWLNPPYSNVSSWTEKMIQHNNGICLVFSRTDTKWAQKAMNAAQSIFFISKRIKFFSPVVESKWTSGAPSMLLSFGSSFDFKKSCLSGIQYGKPIL